MVLRHCVYSRYASFKNGATTVVFIGQESLGHSINGLGQDVGDQIVAHQSAMDLQAWMIYRFLLAQLKKLGRPAFKTMKKLVHNNKSILRLLVDFC